MHRNEQAGLLYTHHRIQQMLKQYGPQFMLIIKYKIFIRYGCDGGGPASGLENVVYMLMKCLLAKNFRNL